MTCEWAIRCQGRLERLMRLLSPNKIRTIPPRHTLADCIFNTLVIYDAEISIFFTKKIAFTCKLQYIGWHAMTIGNAWRGQELAGRNPNWNPHSCDVQKGKLPFLRPKIMVESLHNNCQKRSSNVHLYLSYITQMTSTTNFAFKDCSHDQKCKIQIFERPPPSNSPEIVHHTFRHSTLIVREDPSFWSAEQLEPVFRYLPQTCEEFWIFAIWHCHIVLLPSYLHHQETTSEL